MKSNHIHTTNKYNWKDIISILVKLSIVAVLVLLITSSNLTGKLGTWLKYSLIVEIPAFTGGVADDISEEEDTSLTQFANLRDKTPITTNTFEVQFNYKTNNFVILLSEPYESSKNDFIQWLYDNQYYLITEDSIEYLLN